jgi:hypothetical protein
MEKSVPDRIPREWKGPTTRHIATTPDELAADAEGAEERDWGRIYEDLTPEEREWAKTRRREATQAFFDSIGRLPGRLFKRRTGGTK